MKKSNFKKFLSGIISASMLVAALPMSMAQAAVDTNDVNVLYADGYDTKTTALVHNGVGSVELAYDPTDSSNKVMKVTSTAKVDEQQVINMNLTDETHWNIWSVSDANWNTYAGKGAVDGRPLVFQMQAYFPKAFADKVGLGDNYWSALSMGPQVGSRMLDGGYPIRTGYSGTGHQSITGGWFGSSKDASATAVTPDAWHTFTWIVEGTGDDTLTTVYVDDTKLYNKKAKEDGWNGYSSSTPFSGISVRLREGVALDGESFYIDNVKVYQPKADLTASLAYNEEAKTATLTFNNNVPASMASKIAVTGLTAGTDYTVAVSGKTAEITFASPAHNTTYTVTTTGLIDEYYQALAVNEYSFTTEPSPINVLYEENYDGGEVGNAKEVVNGKTSFANAADPKNSSNKVLRIYSKAEDADPYGKYINARIGGTDTIGDPWGSGKWGSTYEAEGALENRPLVYEMDIYVPSDIKNQLHKDYNADLMFGPHMTAGNPGNVSMAYEMGVDTDTAGQGNPGGAEAWLGRDNWAKKCAFSLDTWYKFKWVITGEGDNTKVSIFMSTDDGATYTTLYNNVDADYKYNRSTTLMHGIGVATRGPVAVASETTGVFIDDVKIYQISKAFDAELAFDQLNATGTINFTNKITADDLAKIVIKNPSGDAVTANKQLSTDGKTVSFSFNSELESSATYTVDLSALADEFGQAIETKTLTFVTARNPIKVIYSEDYEDSYNVMVTYSNVTQYKTAEMTDKDGKTGKVLNVWGTGEKNNDNAHYMNAYLTDQTAVWGGAKKYSEYSNFISGRPIVYEADVYATEVFKNAVPTHWSNASYIGPARQTGNATSGNGALTSFARELNSALLYGTGQGNRKTFNLDTWNSLKWVIEPANDGTDAATMTAYLNGAKINTVTTTFNPETFCMYGINVQRASDGSAPPADSLFIDNVKIWQCESAFGLESATYDPAEEAILVSTGTKPTQKTIDSIKLKRGEEDVTSLITSRAWDDVNSTLKLYVPFASLNVSTEYTLTIPAGSADIYNQVLTTESTANFTTPKSKSVAVKTASVTAEPTASGATVSITLENVAETPGSAWIIMGVYGAYNQLLGVDSTVKENIAKGTADAFTLTTGDNCSAAEEIRVFVWDSPDTIVPLQKSEVVWTKPATE